MQRADVIVIGGGIAGIGAAARLSPDVNVVVLEMESATCYHSTGRSAAVYIRNYGNAVLRQLNAASQSYLEDNGYLSQRGELLLALPEQEHLIEAKVPALDTVEKIDGANLTELVPILREGRFSAALFERDAHDIDVDRLVQDFARELRKNGGTIITNAGVQGLRFANGVWHADTAAGQFEAPIVVNAAGAWADQVGSLANLKAKGLTPMRRSAAIVPMPDHDISKWPLFAGIEEDWYGKPEAGQLMVSPADEDPVEPHDAYPDDMVLAEGLHRFEMATTVPVTRVTHQWAGLRTFAADRTPVVGFDANAEGFFWLAGQGGYGVQTSPALSQLAAELCLGQSTHLSADVIEALSPNRF